MSAVTPLRRPRPAPAPRRPHLRVVPEHRPRHTVVYALAITLVLAATVFGTVSLNALAASDAMAAHELDQEVAEAERRYSQLVAEVAALEDPARIRQAALDQGMVPADSPRYLFLERVLPADGAVTDAVDPGETTDPMKPVLSAER